MTAPAPSPLRGALELVGDIVVGAHGSRSEMPNTPVRFTIAERGSDCPMRDLTSAERCGLVDSSTQQRVPKGKPIAVDVASPMRNPSAAFWLLALRLQRERPAVPPAAPPDG
jgi:hypothetical protein